MQLYRNSVEEIDFGVKLDQLTFEESTKKLEEANSLLIKDGVLKITGLDLDELCRCKFKGFITTREFFGLFGQSKNICSMSERIQQLEDNGFVIKEASLTNIFYHLEATR